MFEIYEKVSRLGRIERFQQTFPHNGYKITIRCTTNEAIEFKCHCQKIFDEYDVIIKYRTPDNRLCPFESLPIGAPERSSENHIFNIMNDICLVNVFKSDELKLWDLVSIANTCKRFNRIAKQAFRQKYNDFTAFDHDSALEPWQFEKFLQTFGKELTSIDMSKFRDADSNVPMLLLLKHCGKNLVNLKYRMHVYLIDVDTYHIVRGLRRLMPQLKQLHIHMDRRLLPIIFKRNKEYCLNTLIISEQDIIKQPVIDFRQLFDYFSVAYETLRSRGVKAVFREEIFRKQLYNREFKGSLDELLQLSENLKPPNWNEMDGSQEPHTKFICFGQLEALKSLDLNIPSDCTSAFILRGLRANRVCLKSLRISTEFSEEVINRICRTKSLTHLEIICRHDRQIWNNLLGIGYKLKHLQHFTIRGKVTFDAIQNILLGRQLMTAKFQIGKMIVTSRSPFEKAVLQQIDELRRNRNIKLRVEIEVCMLGLFANLMHGVSCIDQNHNNDDINKQTLPPILFLLLIFFIRTDVYSSGGTATFWRVVSPGRRSIANVMFKRRGI